MPSACHGHRPESVLLTVHPLLPLHQTSSSDSRSYLGISSVPHSPPINIIDSCSTHDVTARWYSDTISCAKCSAALAKKVLVFRNTERTLLTMVDRTERVPNPNYLPNRKRTKAREPAGPTYRSGVLSKAPCRTCAPQSHAAATGWMDRSVASVAVWLYEGFTLCMHGWMDVCIWALPFVFVEWPRVFRMETWKTKPPRNAQNKSHIPWQGGCRLPVVMTVACAI